MLLLHLEALGHGEQIDRLELGRELLDGLVYQPVLLGVERIGRHELLHRDDAVLFEHQGAQHRLLQLDGLGRHIDRSVGERRECLAVACGGSEIFSHRQDIFSLQK